MEVEDDVFFADLSKRIALLIMDDDDDREDLPARFPSVTLQSLSYPMAMPSRLSDQQMICRRECRGTGVFIPRTSTPRKNRPGRLASFNANKSYKQPEKSRGVSHLTSNLDQSCNYSKSVRRT